MHYYNWGTGDKYYNSGNRRYILQQGEQRMYYYKKGLGDALLQHWEQRINITTGGTGDKSYNRGNRECIIITTLGTEDKYYNRGNRG